jgi:hypothetical protein
VTDVEAGAGGIGKHVENVEFGREFTLVALGERMLGRNGFAGVPGAKGLLLIPNLLPLRLNEIEGILLPATRHKGVEYGERRGKGQLGRRWRVVPAANPALSTFGAGACRFPDHNYQLTE